MSHDLQDQFDIYRINLFTPLSNFTAAYNYAVAKGWRYAEQDLLQNFRVDDETAKRIHTHNITAGGNPEKLHVPTCHGLSTITVKRAQSGNDAP